MSTEKHSNKSKPQSQTSKSDSLLVTSKIEDIELTEEELHHVTGGVLRMHGSGGGAG